MVKGALLLYSCIDHHGKPSYELWVVTCRKDSHIVTCHLMQVNMPYLNSSIASWYSIYLP